MDSSTLVAIFNSRETSREGPHPGAFAGPPGNRY
jgi:hypothetical protein